MATLNGKVALVTGGSRGIGAAIAGTLAKEGANVAITFRQDEQAATEVVASIEHSGGTAMMVRSDAADPEDVIRAFEETANRFGDVNILVNNAGVYGLGPIESFGTGDYNRVMDTHVRGAFVAVQTVSKQMSEGDRIITIGSCLSERLPGPGMTLYALSKSALVGLTKAAARELGARGITVNLVQPGPTNTAMNPEDGESAEFQKSLTALGRYAQPEEIAVMVAYLASPASAYVTGAMLAVDGGFAA